MLSNTASNEGGLIEFTGFYYRSLSDDRHEEAAAVHSAASQWAELAKNSRALQHLPLIKGSHAAPNILKQNSFCTNSFLKVHFMAPWLQQRPPFFCRTQSIWIPSPHLLTNGRNSWLRSCRSWRRLSALSVNSSMPSTRALASGSTSSAPRISKGRLSRVIKSIFLCIHAVLFLSFCQGSWPKIW